MTMSERNLDAVGCLGRVLTFVGLAWLGLVVLGGAGLLSELGISGGFIAAVAGSAIPAIALIVAGRALARRARLLRQREEPLNAARGAPRGGPPSSRPDRPPVRTPPRLPDRSGTPYGESMPRPAQVEPIPAPRPAPTEPENPTEPEILTQLPQPTRDPLGEPATTPPERPLPPTPVAAGPSESPPRKPRTSKEMIAEAKARWGSGRPNRNQAGGRGA